MPLRRRRDRVPIQARTEEQSPARVRVPSRQKAPRSLRRCRPSRGGIQGGSRPERRVERDSRPHDESSRRHGVPEALRGGHARIVQERASPLLGRLGPRSVSSTQVERGVRRAVAYGTWLAGLRCGNAPGDRRNRHRLMPASSGAKAPLACEDRTLVGCARASINGCRSRQASPRLREARLPLATGRVDGGLALDGSKEPAGEKRRRSSAARRPSRGADEVRSRTLERALRGDGPCSMEDTSGHCGSAPRSRGCEAGDLGCLQGGSCPRERRDHHGGRDRGARGSVRTRHGGKTTPTATAAERQNVRPTEANRPERETGDLLDRAGAQALDASRADEARVLVRRT
jgi:hypothetical protein